MLRAQAVADHQPEKAFVYAPVVRSEVEKPGQENKCEVQSSKFEERRFDVSSAIGNCRRPLRLLPRPLEIATTSLVPDGPPIAFRFQGDSHTIAERIGPERIETGWWRGPHVRRDYYRVTTDAGRRCWLFRERDGGKWFLHGWFD